MLLPKIDPYVAPGKLSLGAIETMDINSSTQQLKRSMRQMRGFSAYELTIPGSEAKANLLMHFAGLNKDDADSEEKLSAALDDLLCACLDTIDTEVANYAEEDWGILTTIAAKSLKHSLAEAIRSTVQTADAQLADIRRENAA